MGALLFLTACSGARGQRGLASGGTSNNRPTAPYADENSWLLQDVSILFPIPAMLPDMNAIRTSVSGAKGKLLPDFAGQALPRLEFSLMQNEQVSQLQLIGLRVEADEIHLIWQIFRMSSIDGQQKIGAVDCAVHTFYRVDNQKLFLADLKKLAQLSRPDVNVSQALQVHPTLQAHGWNSQYALGLKNLILTWAGENNLFKVTFTQAPELAHWSFGGFLVEGMRAFPLEIPRIHTTENQLFVNSSSSLDFLAGLMGGNAPTGQDEFNRLLEDSSPTQVKTPSALEAAHFTAVKLENPRLGNPQTLDCASCHMAQMVKDWSEDKQPMLVQTSEGRFTSTGYNLNRVSADKINTENMRAFGYFLNKPTITQRAINDTAYTAEQFNAAGKLQDDGT